MSRHGRIMWLYRLYSLILWNNESLQKQPGSYLSKIFGSFEIVAFHCKRGNRRSISFFFFFRLQLMRPKPAQVIIRMAFLCLHVKKRKFWTLLLFILLKWVVNNFPLLNYSSIFYINIQLIPSPRECVCVCVFNAV